MVQEIRSLKKLAIFFQCHTLGAEGGGLVRGTLRYIAFGPFSRFRKPESLYQLLTPTYL